MSLQVYNVLFVCTHNSARSIMAEALLNSLGRGRFQAFSAGSHPGTSVHPFALTTLSEMHMPTDGLRSKDWGEFTGSGAPELNFVFTVCDQAAGEACPVWPGQPMTAHWGVPIRPRSKARTPRRPRHSGTRRSFSNAALSSCWRCRSRRWTS